MGAVTLPICSGGAKYEPECNDFELIAVERKDERCFIEGLVPLYERLFRAHYLLSTPR